MAKQKNKKQTPQLEMAAVRSIFSFECMYCITLKIAQMFIMSIFLSTIFSFRPFSVTIMSIQLI